MNKRSGQLRWSVSETGNPKILERDGNGDNIHCSVHFCLSMPQIRQTSNLDNNASSYFHGFIRKYALAQLFTNKNTAVDPFSAMACYPQYPYLPIFESNVVSWMLPFSDETRDVKRIKRSSSMVESLRSNNGRSLYSGGRSICRSSSTNSLNNIAKLHVRDHIWIYTQRYLAA